MLVISLKEQENFFVGDDIEVRVLELHRGKVRVGIKAPKGLLVLRGELKDRKDKGRASKREDS
jgi:carbon storage regulator